MSGAVNLTKHNAEQLGTEIVRHTRDFGEPLMSCHEHQQCCTIPIVRVFLICR